MTANRRIVLNVVATYGRSLYALALGLFAGRWTLMVLGEVDYGLSGLIGGLVTFITFLTWTSSAAIGRYYGVSVGAMKLDYENGLEECRRWFTVAVAVHWIIPIVLFMIGYPLGEWAVRHFLTIPTERVLPCVWVWRFVCFSTFVSVLAVPFSAMYTAKQYIAELTIYSFVTSTLMFVFQYYMVVHPGDWLVRLSLWSCVLSVAPQVIIAIRAVVLFPECRLRLQCLKSWASIRELLCYSVWNLFSSLMSLLQGQGIAVIVNKYFGPTVNAAYQIGNTVSGHTGTLSASVVGAFSPAIMNAYGAKEYARANLLANRTCKFCTLLLCVFAIPLILETDGVLGLWLKTPPRYTVDICRLVLLTAIVGRLTSGFTSLINATGNVAAFQTLNGVAIAFSFPLAWVMVACGFGVYCVPAALLVTAVLLGAVALYYSAKYARFRCQSWLREVFLSVMIVSFVSAGVGVLPRLWMEPSVFRVVQTCVLSTVAFCLSSWKLAFNSSERAVVIEKIVMHWRRVSHCYRH